MGIGGSLNQERPRDPEEEKRKKAQSEFAGGGAPKFDSFSDEKDIADDEYITNDEDEDTEFNRARNLKREKEGLSDEEVEEYTSDDERSQFDSYRALISNQIRNIGKYLSGNQTSSGNIAEGQRNINSILKEINNTLTTKRQLDLDDADFKKASDLFLLGALCGALRMFVWFCRIIIIGIPLDLVVNRLSLAIAMGVIARKGKTTRWKQFFQSKAIDPLYAITMMTSGSAFVSGMKGHITSERKIIRAELKSYNDRIAELVSNGDTIAQSNEQLFNYWEQNKPPTN